jgi:hypothetical protein
MSSKGDWKRIKLDDHPDSLVVVKWKFVHSRFGKGVLLIDDTGTHWITWGSVIVDQFEDLEHWLKVEGHEFKAMRMYFYAVDSLSGRRYLMVSSKPRGGES